MRAIKAIKALVVAGSVSFRLACVAGKEFGAVRPKCEGRSRGAQRGRSRGAQRGRARGAQRGRTRASLS